MPWVILSVVVAVGLLLGGLKFEASRVAVWKTRAQQCEHALKDQAAADAKAQDRAKKALADAKKVEAGKQKAIDQLIKESSEPSKLTRVQQCERAEAILREIGQ